MIEMCVIDPAASTIVNVNIYLRTINDINDYKMVSFDLENFPKIHLIILLQEMAVQITFRQKWNDPRLRFDDFHGNYLSF